MANNSVEVRSGMGPQMVLTVIFIVLKVTGAVDWSWWWVLSPLWITLLISIVLIVIVSIFFGLGSRR